MTELFMMKLMIICSYFTPRKRKEIIKKAEELKRAGDHAGAAKLLNKISYRTAVILHELITVRKY